MEMNGGDPGWNPGWSEWTGFNERSSTNGYPTIILAGIAEDRW